MRATTLLYYDRCKSTHLGVSRIQRVKHANTISMQKMAYFRTLVKRAKTVRRRYFFSGSFMFLFCLVFAMSLCASVYMCFVVTRWERADLLALVCCV